MGRGSRYNDRSEHFVVLNLKSFNGTAYFIACGSDGKLYILGTEPATDAAVLLGTVVGDQ